MPLLDIDPGASPEAPGTLYFYEQGADPSTGFQVTSRGQILSTVGAAYTGATAATDVFTSKVTGDAANRFVVNADGKLEWADGTAAPDTNLYRFNGTLRTDSYTELAGGQSDGDWTVFGLNLTLGTAGGGLKVKEGTNARMGVGTLVAGTVTVNTTAVTANSRIFLTAQNTGGTPGALRVSARSAGTSFTVTSTSGTDTSTVAWFLVEPAS